GRERISSEGWCAAGCGGEGRSWITFGVGSGTGPGEGAVDDGSAGGDGGGVGGSAVGTTTGGWAAHGRRMNSAPVENSSAIRPAASSSGARGHCWRIQSARSRAVPSASQLFR